MQTNLAEKRPVVMPSLPLGKSLVIEQFGPAVGGLGAGLAVAWIRSLWLLRAPWHDQVLDRAVEIELGILARLVAIVAFLPAIEDKTIIRKLKQWGWYKRLVGYLKESITISAIAMFFTFAMIVLPEGWRDNVKFNRIISSTWWGVIAYSIFAALRIVNLSIKSLMAD